MRAGKLDRKITLQRFTETRDEYNEPEPTMNVLFSADHDYNPNGRVTIAYKAGWSGPVPAPCGRCAIELGRATEVDAPTREEAAQTGPVPVLRYRKKA